MCSSKTSLANHISDKCGRDQPISLISCIQTHRYAQLLHIACSLLISEQAYWTEQLQAFHELAAVDGIWIDMNEVSNFCNSDGTGQVCQNTASSGCPAPGASQTDCCLVCSNVDPSNKYDYPPYSIHNCKGKLSTKTTAVSATQYGNATVYDTHNLYGLTEQIATASALKTIRGKRPFALSRSAFLSTGVHSAKWTGDNGTWQRVLASDLELIVFCSGYV